MPATLYRADITHRRFVGAARAFRYRAFYLLLDLDTVAADLAQSRLLSHNRGRLLSFHDRDHGPRDGSPLKPWVEELLRERGIEIGGGRVRLLCLPRLFGYVFDPISLWYCEDRAGTLRAVVCEVRNTFGEGHCYVLTGPGNAPLEDTDTLRKAKRLHVSPFFSTAGEYRFRLRRPGTRLTVGIDYYRDGERALYAGLTGRQRPFTDRALLAELARTPLVTFKVIAMIHWQALMLWLRGLPVQRKPAPPTEGVS